ncbi:MAG: Rieske 2Fe-2S domain-containing protein [Bacteroidia bacterium]|nr:Rieske 2Fe-2S domain-containing protein [Bacteroidia bacterium]
MIWHSIQFPGLPAWVAGEGDPLREVAVAGKELCLVRRDSGIRAIDARCPHARGPLAAGFLNEAQHVVCPWHRFAFDPDTGQSNSGGYFVTCYDVKVDGKSLLIGIPKKKRWWQ